MIQFINFCVQSALTIQVSDFILSKAEWISVEAPSGFGKTTLLRGIAGLEKTSGKIIFNGNEIQSLPPAKRNIGMVFQDHLLFPHMTAGENIAYGMTVRHQRSEGLARAKQLMKLLQLEDKFDAPITVLSGGERQRIAILRAVCFQPDLLILDEPFKGLDDQIKAVTFQFLRDFSAQNKLAVILVSHPNDFKVADFKVADFKTESTQKLIGQLGENSNVRTFHSSRS